MVWSSNIFLEKRSNPIERYTNGKCQSVKRAPSVSRQLIHLWSQAARAGVGVEDFECASNLVRVDVGLVAKSMASVKLLARSCWKNATMLFPNVGL